MASINLFLLDELSRGEAHGHQLRLKAHAENVDVWTDIRVSGIYAALKRLAAAGLIVAARTEVAGRRPERTVYRITQDGREALEAMRRDDLRAIVFRTDPFDLALQRSAEVPIDSLVSILADRRADLAARAADLRTQVGEIEGNLNAIERRIVGHVIGRLDYEVGWHDALLEDIQALHQDLKLTRGADG